MKVVLSMDVKKTNPTTRVERLKEYVEGVLSDKKFNNFYYHNIVHTIDVYNSAKMYAKMERISEKYIDPLLAAALLHDIGYLKQQKGHEEIGARMADRVLRKYGFKSEEIALVKRLILATKFPQNPGNDKLEHIICDADLDTLGTERFLKRSMDLKKELERISGKKIANKEWYQNQLKLLESHKYFTSSARKLRNEGQKKNIKRLEMLLTRINIQ